MINPVSDKSRDDYYGTLYTFNFSNHKIIIRVGGEKLPKTINRFITNDKSNIDEICYRFDITMEDIHITLQSMVQALNQLYID